MVLDFKLIGKVFLVLFVGILFAAFGAIPYITELLDSLPEDSVGMIPPDFVLGILIVIQLSICTFIGLIISKQINLGAPVIESLVNKEQTNINWKRFIVSAILIGFLVGTFILISDYVFYLLGSDLSFFSSKTELPHWTKGLVGSFFGGIGEEIIYRLFFMSLIIWIFNMLSGNNEKTPSSKVVWTAMIVSAILFSLAHIPLTSSLTAITVLVVVRAILLNSIAGIGFGYLYWKKGLLYAMIAHFFADITLHVIAVQIFG